MPAKTCSYHCDGCGRHFNSLEAFDVHRVFEEGHEGDWNHRVCMHPLDDPRERYVLHGVGRCDPRHQVGVHIWTLKRGLERGRRMRGRAAE